MKCPQTITLTRVAIVPGSLPIRHAGGLTQVEFTVSHFLRRLESMYHQQLLPDIRSGPAYQCTRVALAGEPTSPADSFFVLEARDTIRQMIEALPDEDEPEQSEPGIRFVCDECSAEYGLEEIVSEDRTSIDVICPSCGGKLQ